MEGERWLGVSFTIRLFNSHFSLSLFTFTFNLSKYGQPINQKAMKIGMWLGVAFTNRLFNFHFSLSVFPFNPSLLSLSICYNMGSSLWRAMEIGIQFGVAFTFRLFNSHFLLLLSVFTFNPSLLYLLFVKIWTAYCRDQWKQGCGLVFSILSFHFPF